MNEEFDDFIQEVKALLPWLIAAGLVVAGYHGVKKYMADRRAAAAEIVTNAFTTDELEDAVAKFKGAKSAGVLQLRLAKSYFDGGRYDEALAVYASLDGKDVAGFADSAAVGRAQCLEALGRFDEAAKAFDDFAEANPGSFLALTARLGAARAIAQSGAREKALERLEALKDTVEEGLDKTRVESTIDLVKRYEKRAEVSLFDTADAAQKQLEADAEKDAAAAEKAAPEAKPADGGEPSEPAQKTE